MSIYTIARTAFVPFLGRQMEILVLPALLLFAGVVAWLASPVVWRVIKARPLAAVS